MTVAAVTVTVLLVLARGATKQTPQVLAEVEAAHHLVCQPDQALHKPDRQVVAAEVLVQLEQRLVDVVALTR